MLACARASTRSRAAAGARGLLAVGQTARRWLSGGPGAELQANLRPILDELGRKGSFATAHGNESDGGAATLFACPVLEHAHAHAHAPAAGVDPRAILMGGTPHWERSSGEPVWFALDLDPATSGPDESLHPDAFLTVTWLLDAAAVAESWVGEAGEDDHGCSEADAYAMREAVQLLNEASAAHVHGACFEFARPCRASPRASVYTVGAGCVCADGTLVGWRQDNVVWT